MPGKLLSRRCPVCNTPSVAGTMLKWTNGGTIDLFLGYDLRMVVIDPEIFDHIFSRVEDMIGMPIDRIVYEAQKNITKLLFAEAPAYVTLFGLMKHFTPGKKVVVQFFNLLALYAGLGLSETRDYKSGQFGVGYIRNPFNPSLLAGNVVGAFEFLEEKPYEYTWQHQESDSFLIKVSASNKVDEMADRFKMELNPVIPGNPGLERCPRCGVPTYVSSRLSWDLQEGTIKEISTGSRMIFFPAHMLFTAFRELAIELGDEIYDLLINSQSDWTSRNLDHYRPGAGKGRQLTDDEKGEALENFVTSLPAYGYGNPISFNRAETIRMVVENPYNIHILGGMLKGVCQGLEERTFSLSWEQLGKYKVAFELK